jgi:hypothetical protein
MGPRGAEHLEHAGLLRVVALDAQEDLAIGVVGKKDVALVEQFGLVGDEVGVAAAFEAELAAEFLRPKSQIPQRDLHLAMSDDFILDAGLDDRAGGEQRAIQRGLRAADGLDGDAKTKAEPQMRATAALRSDFSIAILGEREVDLRAGERLLRVEVRDEVVEVDGDIAQHDTLAGVEAGKVSRRLLAAADEDVHAAGVFQQHHVLEAEGHHGALRGK